MVKQIPKSFSSTYSERKSLIVLHFYRCMFIYIMVYLIHPQLHVAMSENCSLTTLAEITEPPKSQPN